MFFCIYRFNKFSKDHLKNTYLLRKLTLIIVGYTNKITSCNVFSSFTITKSFKTTKSPPSQYYSYKLHQILTMRHNICIYTCTALHLKQSLSLFTTSKAWILLELKNSSFLYLLWLHFCALQPCNRVF